MSALLNKDSWTDPSKKAANILDYVLDDTSKEVIAEREVQSSVEEELVKAPIAERTSNRKQSRVLFITRSIGILEPNSTEQLHYKNVASMFDEVHIIVLAESWQAKKGVERLGTNIWAYTTSGKYWWMQPFIASSIAHSQLRFADGFRPDVVVALDPFESGLSGLFIAEKYNREFQVHITEDLYDPEFVQKDANNKWRLRIASYVLKRTQSVRLSTTTIKESISKKFQHIKDIALLPRHYDIQTIMAAAESIIDTKDIFPQFSFVVLFAGKLDHESTLFRALDAARSILSSPRIGLIVVGDGPMKKEFQKRAEILGIQKQVIFDRDENKLISYLKAADVLLCTDTTEASDEMVIKAAAAGLPIIGAITELRADLFTDGESIFLCQKEDTIDFSQKLVKFLNVNSLRAQFSTNAKDVIKSRLHEDPDAYKIAYKDSIEMVFSTEEEAKKA